MAVKKIYIDDEYEDWNESDWEDYVEEKAEKIAAQRIKQNRKYGYVPKPGDQEAYAKEYKRRMLKAYPFDKFNDQVYSAFENMGDETGMKWLDGWKDLDPLAVHERIKFKQHLPLLKGIAEDGEDWYSMGNQKLKDIGGEMGYKTGTQEGFAKFMKNLEKYQLQYDRAKLMKEMDEIPGSTLTKIAYPTLSRAIENAVAEGGDLTPGQAVGLGILDAGINAGQFLAPSLNALKARPVLNAALDAGLQGGLEAGRQGLGYAVADVDPDFVQAPITALTAGLTRPAMFGTTQGLMGGLTGPNWMSFRRGMMGSTRVGNPVLAERAALEKSIDEFNRQMARNLEQEAVENTVGKPIDLWLDMAQKNAAIRANLPAELSKQLKVPRVAGEGGTLSLMANPEDQARRMGEGLFLDKKKILDAYDNINPLVSVRFKDGVATVNKTVPESQTRNIMKGVTEMGGDEEQALRSLIPNKFADLEERNKWYNAGMGLGTFVNDLGGRFEPTFKFNLLNPIQSSPFKDDKEAYKKTDWYKKLSPKSKALVDEAYKKKEEELDVDLLEEE